MKKVLHLSYKDSKGGAAIAAYRHYLSMNESNKYISKMLVLEKYTDDSGVHQLKKSTTASLKLYLIRFFNKIFDYIFRNRKDKILFSTGFYGFRIRNSKVYKQADIIYIHWINNFLNLNEIRKIAKEKETYWVLHDMWLFTGGCHYSGNCVKYENSCTKCPILESKYHSNITSYLQKYKSRKLSDLNIKYICCSHWLSDCAKKSRILSTNCILVKKNPVSKHFHFINNEKAKMSLQLPISKKYILFGAISSVNDLRKGWDLLMKVIDKIEFESDVELLVFGNTEETEISSDNLKVNFLGTVFDEITLSNIYNASEVFLAPSRQDNLPNTVNESIHCKTPVVAFNIGGMPDLIMHKQNGYLAKPFDIDDFIKGIHCFL